MRRLLAALSLLSLLVAGCETSSLGARCVINTDCDRRTTGMTARCVKSTNPESTCSGGSMDYCICCPIVIDPMDTTIPAACRGGTNTDTGPSTDAADTVVVDTGVDSGPADTGSDANDVVTTDVTDTGPGCSCSTGQFCETTDAGMQCVPQRPIGATCGTGTECQTNHCVESVCCNSACTGAGLSCNVSPDFAGLCTPIASVDAGTE